MALSLESQPQEVVILKKVKYIISIYVSVIAYVLPCHFLHLNFTDFIILGNTTKYKRIKADDNGRRVYKFVPHDVSTDLTITFENFLDRIE